MERKSLVTWARSAAEWCGVLSILGFVLSALESIFFKQMVKLTIRLGRAHASSVLQCRSFQQCCGCVVPLVPTSLAAHRRDHVGATTVVESASSFRGVHLVVPRSPTCAARLLSNAATNATSSPGTFADEDDASDTTASSTTGAPLAPPTPPFPPHTIVRNIEETDERRTGPAAAAAAGQADPVATMHDTFHSLASGDSTSPDTDAFPPGKPEHDVPAAVPQLPPPWHDCATKLLQLLRATPALPSGEDLGKAITAASSERELQRLLRDAVFVHPLFFDTINGHGFRVHVISKVTTACVRLAAIEPWWRVVAAARGQGFLLSRPFIASLLDILRRRVIQRFDKEGRNIDIATSTIQRLRGIMLIAAEDGIPFDWVLYARTIGVVVNVAACFDRQNVFRNAFPSNDVPRRDGIIPDWVVTPERLPDTDAVIAMCDQFIERHVILDLKSRVGCRPVFSVMARLADYYFQVDDVTKMIGILEDCDQLGVDISDSTAAKAIQLACALNLADAPRLMLQLRFGRNNATITGSDFSRLMLYYCKSGGGRPCPVCGEAFNHRNVSLGVWQATPREQRDCPMLVLARKHKGVLQDDPSAAQCQDWSHVAYACWDMSRLRGVPWTAVEWRMFLTCCLFSDRALEAAALCETEHPKPLWDAFLASTFLRVLRFHAPSRVGEVVAAWRRDGIHMSPLTLQEAAMAVMCIDDDRQRLPQLRLVHDLNVEHDVYTMPYTNRYIAAVMAARYRNRQQVAQPSTAPPAAADGATAGDAAAAAGPCEEETRLVNRLCHIAPKHLMMADVKDSTSDILPGTHKGCVVYTHQGSRRAAASSRAA